MKVIKRDGKIVDFDKTKIAMAIRKGFVNSRSQGSYTEEDHNKVLVNVVDDLKKKYKEDDNIPIEEIQDLIELELKNLGFIDIYETFSSYRTRRSESRKAFQNRQHKLMKAIEGLSLKTAIEEDAKRDNANVDGNTPMGTMLQYGSTLSREFAKSYIMNPKFASAHDSGEIYIHDMDFMPMGTTTCCQINIEKLFKTGFSTGHGHLRPPKDIMSYSALAAIAIQSNQNDQHGGQAIPAFDFYMAPGVKITFKKQFKQALTDYIDLVDEKKVVDMDKLIKKIDDLKTISFDIKDFKEFYEKDKTLERVFQKAYDSALQKTDRRTYQAMEAFVHNLNTMHSRAGAQVPFSSINFGTDTSYEGRMVIKNYLLALDSGLGKGETPIFPISIFKVKEGVNYFEKDPNYDMFKLACKVSAKRLFPNFSFLDAPFNKQYYKKGNPDTEVAYMGCRTRVMGNVANPDKEITTGRGNLSFTSINLVRLGIKHGIVTNDKPDFEGFYKELDEKIDLVKEQLLERFHVQCSKKVYNFPFLLGQGLFIGADGLGPNDDITPILRNGSLGTGFIGLAECLTALIGQHHGESEEARKLGLEIIKHMRERLDKISQEYKLNFTLLATPAEGLSGTFVGIDRSIYGSIPGVTDKKYYTNSYHVPVAYNISIVDKIKIEAPYHAYTNGGHITYVELDGDTANNLEAFESIVRCMHDNNIGYGAINHPVDRDPVCGYTGVIGDVCPGCGRHESEGIPMEAIGSSCDARKECASVTQ